LTGVSRGLIIRVSGVRVPPPLLSQSVALACTVSPKSAIHKGLGAFFAGGLKALSSHPVVPVCPESRPDCCAYAARSRGGVCGQQRWRAATIRESPFS
jgi:hypothetical protein